MSNIMTSLFSARVGDVDINIWQLVDRKMLELHVNAGNSSFLIVRHLVLEHCTCIIRKWSESKSFLFCL